MVIRNPLCDCGDGGICNELALECHPCCRCIPLRLCITFEAEDCECDGYSQLLTIDANEEYVGSILCGDQLADILIHILYENEVCYWRVVSELLAIDSRFEITGGDTSCEDPKLTVEVDFDLCSGELKIERYELEILEPRVEDCVEEPWCGDCKCICKTLCVALNNGSSVAVDELTWDEETRTWGYVTLAKDEQTGICVALVDGFDPIPITDCELGLTLFARNSEGHIFTAKCKECSCSDVCLGCCLPTTFDYTAGWIPADIPFSVSAPNCEALDGFEQSFVHVPAIWDWGACGICATYWAPGSIQFLGKRPSAPGTLCTDTPCTVRICFALTCVGRDTEVASPGCCDQLRLFVIFTEPFDGSRKLEHAVGECGHNAFSLAPQSCVCDEHGDVSAVFDLGQIGMVCNKIIQSGPCYGRDECCLVFDCSLDGALLVI